jgi:hypothetical protein
MGQVKLTYELEAVQGTILIEVRVYELKFTGLKKGMEAVKIQPKDEHFDKSST